MCMQETGIIHTFSNIRGFFFFLNLIFSPTKLNGCLETKPGVKKAQAVIFLLLPSPCHLGSKWLVTVVCTQKFLLKFCMKCVFSHLSRYCNQVNIRKNYFFQKNASLSPSFYFTKNIYIFLIFQSVQYEIFRNLVQVVSLHFKFCVGKICV